MATHRVTICDGCGEEMFAGGKSIYADFYPRVPMRGTITNSDELNELRNLDFCDWSCVALFVDEKRAGS